MKILTYNFLTSKALKGVAVGFPLKLKISKKEVVQAEFDSEFISRIISRLDWSTVYRVSELVGLCSDVPQKLPANYASDQDLLLKIHHLLLEIDIIEGEMECPETGKVFPILNGIPNMLSNEDEV